MLEAEMLLRKIERERQSRKQAESLLEQKALELYEVNHQLRTLNESLEQKVEERTFAVQASQTRLSALIANLHAGVLVEDEHRKIALTNQMFCALFKIPATPEVLIGVDCSQSAEQSKHLFEQPEYFVDRIATILDARITVIDEECRMLDGRILERDYIPIMLDDQYLGHLWQYRDVTEERKTRDALRRSEEKYRGIIENMELGLLEVDLHERITRAYPRFCEMVGYSQEELLGKNAVEVFLPPEFVALMEKQGQTRATGQSGVYEVLLRQKNGEYIWALISGTPIFDLDGQVIGSMGIHYDITYQKNLQRDLEDARRRAEEAQEAEKQFLANISHEIRTPLNGIIGMSNLLYDTQPTEEQREYLAILKNSTEILRVLITDVLDLSKVRSGKLEVQQNEFDLVGLVGTIVKSLQLRLEEKPVVVETQIDPRLQNIVIGDDLLVNQILFNLIGNAEKFTEKGRIKVSLQLVEATELFLAPEPDIFVAELRVADSGIGISPEKHDIIFHTFRQVDGDIKRRFGGTGLGLAITQQLVELQGGTIRVESQLGKGSTFIVRLPFRDTGKPITQEEAIFTQSQYVLNPTGKNLLVVEDNAMNRKYIGVLLRKWGIEYQFAVNGREGFEVACTTPFTLILMDIQMPEMDGYETTMAIRERAPLNQNTPIIALTASALLSQKDRAFTSGMNDYLSKPFTPNQLFQKIQAFFQVEASEAAPTEAAATNVLSHPRIDAAALDALYGGDLDYVQEMFGVFLELSPDFQEWRGSAARQDWVELARLSHKLKPTFGMVGASDLEQWMQDLETAAKKEADPAYIQAIFKKIETLLPATVEAVKQIFDKLKNR